MISIMIFRKKRKIIRIQFRNRIFNTIKRKIKRKRKMAYKK